MEEQTKIRYTHSCAELEILNQIAYERYNGSCLFDYQKDIFWRLEKNEYNIFLKSRQLGVSDIVSGISLLQTFRGQEHLIISTNLRQSGNIIRYAQRWKKYFTNYFPDFQDKIITENKSEIEFENGGRLLCLANSESGSRGLSADRIIFDEFAFFLHGSDESIWRSMLPSLTTKKKKSVCLISTPFGEGNLFYHIFTDKLQFPDFKRAFYHWSERPDLDINMIRRQLDEYSWLQEYEGKFLGDMGSYYPYGLLREAIDIESEYMNLIELSNIQTPCYCAIDIGRRVDFTAIVIVSLIDGKLKVVYKQVLKSEKEKEWGNQEAIISQILATGKINRMYIDSGGIGDQIAEKFSRETSIVKKFNFTNANKSVMFPNFKKKLEEKFIQYPNDQEIINSLHLIERTQSGGDVIYGSDKRTDQYGHQDLAIAVILACYCYDMENSSIINPIAKEKVERTQIDKKLNRNQFIY